MFKKIKNIKNIIIISASTFLIFVICSIIFLIVSNIKLNNKVDELLNRSNIRIQYNQD